MRSGGGFTRMTAAFLGVALVLLAVAVVLGAKWRTRRSAPQAEPQEDRSLEDLGRQAVERARRDVERVGWHLLMVGGSETSAGFVFTIGLWQTYQHPELILFAPAQNPQGMAGRLKAVAERVANGETFEAGTLYPGLLGKHPGAFREVQSQWHPMYLGTAAAFYESFDFPALQLFWPDGDGRFPWENHFAKDLFGFQPLLGEKNGILANVGLATILQASSDRQLLPEALGEVLAKWKAEESASLLEDWRWLLGPELSLLQATIFGDLILKSPDGHVHWLDTGSAALQEIGTSDAEGVERLCEHPAIFFPVSTLLELRALGWKPSTGQVYSWRQPPMLGGSETVDNVDLVSLNVHLSNLGRTAFAIKDLPVGAKIDGFEFKPLG
jgi:hypothetical protein